MRAVKNNLPTPSGEVGESEDRRRTRAVGDQPAYPLESRREKLGQFPTLFSPSSSQLLRSFGKVAAYPFDPRLEGSAEA